MSRQVIVDLVLPIVVSIVSKKGVNVSSHADIQDSQLINYFEEEMERNFSICGQSGNCAKLREAIEEHIKRAPEEFKEYVRLLLNRYIQMRVGLEQMKHLDKAKNPEEIRKILLTNCGEGGNPSDGPPDRFSEFRKKKGRNPLDRWRVA